MSLSEEAQQVINLSRDLKLLNDERLHTLQTLFSYRLNADLMKTLIIGKEATLVDSLFAILRGSNGATTLGYTLRFTADLCQQCPSMAVEFARRGGPSSAATTDPCVFFADLIDTHREDLGIFNPAIFLLGCTLAQEGANQREAPTVERPQLVAKFLAVLQTRFSMAETNFERIEYCICAAAAFLRRQENRNDFARAGLISHVPRLLSGLLACDSPTVVQSIYELLLCARLLSFNYELLGELHKSRILPVCHRALQRMVKEKCVRMALYVLKNFAQAEVLYREAQKGSNVGGHSIMTLTRIGRGSGPTFLGDMVGMGLPKTLVQQAKKKFGDSDINAETEALLVVLEGVQAGSTSWSEYKGEMDSGVLEWSPCHTNVKFWKENVKRIEENGFDIVKQLGQMLLTSKDETTLAVACNDLGEMIRIHPTGHLIMSLPGLSLVKERVMSLMANNSVEVSKQALACVKKLLMLRWEH